MKRIFYNERKLTMEKAEIYRPQYNDRFTFLIVRDTVDNKYRFVNATSGTILKMSFDTIEKAQYVLSHIEGWEIEKEDKE